MEDCLVPSLHPNTYTTYMALDTATLVLLQINLTTNTFASINLMNFGANRATTYGFNIFFTRMRMPGGEDTDPLVGFPILVIFP
jgi:hypothetical protein